MVMHTGKMPSMI
jgi:hypothetical protein